MTSVLLAIDDLGLAIQVQEGLEASGYRVAVDPARASGPGGAAGERPDVVVLSTDPPEQLQPAVEAWRKADPPPGIVAIGAGAAAGARAAAARTPFVAASADRWALAAAIESAARLRFAGGLSRRLALRALGLDSAGDAGVDAIRVVKQAREADIDLVREALRWHAPHYVAPTKVLDLLREHRALDIPEVELSKRMDGTRSVQTLVKSGVVDGWRAARTIWALGSVGAVTLTEEPSDLATPERRALFEMRRHLRARQARLARATHFDVLEVVPSASPEHIEYACRVLAARYAPKRLAALDLAALQPLAAPIWNQILQARATLLDWAERGTYNEWVGAHLRELRTEWAAPTIDADAAADFFAKGQKALLAGDVQRAVSDMAAACRWHPGHPDYEVSLAWARCRADAEADKDRAEAARRERAVAEQALVGRRAWPRALTALGLLCVADGDPDAARFHLREALAIDPNLPAARRLLQRL